MMAAKFTLGSMLDHWRHQQRNFVSSFVSIIIIIMLVSFKDVRKSRRLRTSRVFDVKREMESDCSLAKRPISSSYDSNHLPSN